MPRLKKERAAEIYDACVRAERMRTVLDCIADCGSVEVGKLASSLGVSGATIRRDLDALHEQGLLTRTHGGAIATGALLELPTRKHPRQCPPDVQRIGRKASQLVADGAVVGVTGGAIGREVARALVNRVGITIVTNALSIATGLVLRRDLSLVVVGGMPLRPSYELVGPAAETMLAHYYLDLAFVEVDGITVREGCTVNDEMEASTRAAIIQRSRRSVIVTESSNVGHVAFAEVCGIASITDVVTDDDVTPSKIAELTSAGVQVMTA